MDSQHAAQGLLYLALVLLFAKVFGGLAERLKQPPVIGELVAGILLGGSALGWIRLDDTLLFLAELGAVLLLFEIGLDSDLSELLRVGPSAMLVAVVGVIGPFVVGYFVSLAFGLDSRVAIFIGATLTATSVGITARTLTDIGRLQTPEAQIILGAAVIDDVLGLIILAVVSGLVVHGSISVLSIVTTTLLSIGFLVGAIVIGIPVAPHMLRFAKKLRTRGTLTISAIIFCLVLAFAAEKMHLAPIVGAFAAGLVLAHTDDLAHIQVRMKPIADLFVPIFFVSLGIRVDLNTFNPMNPGSKGMLGFIGVLIVVAAVMKIFAGLGVLTKGVNRLAVGIGMIPRGEVGFIFASIGLTRNVITAGEYAAIIAVIAVTTFVTPPVLRAVMCRTKG